MKTSLQENLAGEQSDVRPSLLLGQRGEALAAAYLLQKGYRLVAANFVIPVGRSRRGALISVEVDLVAYDDQTLCFIEVKTRESDWFAKPEANVDRRKQRQIARAAHAYRRMFDLEMDAYRFDIVTVVMRDSTGLQPEINLLRNFWNEEVFRKRSWLNKYYD